MLVEAIYDTMTADYSKKDLQRAISDVLNSIEQRQTASRHGMPRSTLKKHILDNPNAADRNENQQRLFRASKEKVVQWILN